MSAADPSLPLIQAVRAAILADATLAAAVGNRVTIEWGEALAAPFIRTHVASTQPWHGEDAGEEAVVAGVPCGDFDRGTRARFDCHVFGEEVAVHQIAARLVAVLHDNAMLSPAGHELAGFRHRETRYLRDGDTPQWRHAVVSFNASTIP